MSKQVCQTCFGLKPDGEITALPPFREALVKTEAYEIKTAGPDAKSGRRLPYAFRYHLVTAEGAPAGSSPDRPAGADEQRAESAGDPIPRTASRERVE